MRVLLDRVSKYFGQVKAVQELTIQIEDGEFMALLGPSGCGKTTTLLVIAGFYKPATGLVLFDERVVNDLPPQERNIGMVFQSYALYPHMTVFDNIAFPLRLKGMKRKEIVSKVQAMAAFLHIEELLNRRPGELSGGQQQRVALARALIKEPKLLLLDEPLSNLDAKLRVEMRGELKRLQKQLGITTVFVTHDQLEAMTMADRIAVLKEGKLQQIGRPEDLYFSPSNVFVADFIGTPPMNFFQGSLLREEERMFIVTGHFSIPLAERDLKRPWNQLEGREVIIGVRPENIVIGQGEIEGTIYVVEPLGRETLVTLKVGNTMVRVLAPPGFLGVPGERVILCIDASKIHIFDKTTGEAI
ncbi:MAG: ABC transporter ATP-binding protein [Candidatus Methanomethyliaceae archaeon]